MKALFILVILVAFCSFTVYSARKNISIFEAVCMSETNVTESQFRKYHTNGLKANEANENIKCMMKCVMEKRGVLKNGVLDTEKAYKDVMLVEELRVHEDDVKQSVNGCKTEKGANECDTAFKIIMCLLEFKSRNPLT